MKKTGWILPFLAPFMVASAANASLNCSEQLLVRCASPDLEKGWSVEDLVVCGHSEVDERGYSFYLSLKFRQMSDHEGWYPVQRIDEGGVSHYRVPAESPLVYDLKLVSDGRDRNAELQMKAGEALIRKWDLTCQSSN